MEKIKITRKIKYWIPFLIWAFIIYSFSAQPTVSVSTIHWGDFFIKKSAHLIEYFIFTTLLYRALISEGFSKEKAGIWAIYAAMIYAATDEYHQSFTPGREPALRDVIFDAIGAVSAIYVLWRFIPKAPKKLRSLAQQLEIN